MQQEKTAEGYAVVMKGKLLPRTVCETKRGAMVNWLVSYARVHVLNSAKDADIAYHFRIHSAAYGAFLFAVTISTTEVQSAEL